MRPEMKIGLIVGGIAIVCVVFWWFSNDTDQKDTLPFDKTTVDAGSPADYKQVKDEHASHPIPERRVPDRSTLEPRDSASRLSQQPAVNKRTTPPATPRTDVPFSPGTQSGDRNDPGSRFPSRGDATGTGAPAPNAGSNTLSEATPNKQLAEAEKPSTPAERSVAGDSAPGTAVPRTTPPATRQEAAENKPSERLLPERQTPILTPAGGSNPANPVTAHTPVSPPAPRDTGTKTYKIKEGDYLITIAEAEYGDGELWTAIKNANPGLDENRLKIGQEIKLPSKAEIERSAAGQFATPGRTTTPGSTDAAAQPTTPTSKPAPAASRATYKVETGDTLTRIAKKILGDGKRWREIYELNRDKISSPDVVVVGTELKLPAVTKTAEQKR